MGTQQDAHIKALDAALVHVHNAGNHLSDEPTGPAYRLLRTLENFILAELRTYPIEHWAAAQNKKGAGDNGM